MHNSVRHSKLSAKILFIYYMQEKSDGMHPSAETTNLAKLFFRFGKHGALDKAQRGQFMPQIIGRTMPSIFPSTQPFMWRFRQVYVLFMCIPHPLHKHGALNLLRSDTPWTHEPEACDSKGDVTETPYNVIMSHSA